MARQKISKRTVDALTWRPPGPPQQFLWDTSLLGFGIYVLASGQKTYVCQFRRDGRSQRVKIGPHGPLTPEQARAEAARVLGRVAHGEDPAAEKRERRAALTVNAIADEWLAEHIEPLRKLNTISEYRRIVDIHIRPRLGRDIMRDLKRADLAALRAELRETPTMANKALAVFGSLWAYAAKTGHVDADANPVRGVERYREQARERFLTVEELARIGEALRLAETEGLPWAIDEKKPGAKHAPRESNRRRILDPFAVAAIRLLILTGARLREILHAQWSQVDLQRGVIFLPDSKSGKKPIYLSAGAQAVLVRLPRIENNPHIIVGGKDGAPRADLKKPWAAVCAAAGLEGVRLHDLRHSFASFGAGASLGLPIIGKLLGHSQPQTTARYAHLDQEPLRRAVDAIGATISAAMDGKASGDVVPLKKPRGNAK
ncbi:site-specific integrase [Methylocystis sp. FS]|uniref:site-specific integrase n=1 Tax=Methylocystis silviterrae TaxID=2743612 RepID=UPI001582C397|nr:site-specific integrase [Methylocystis silviterrae]NUJ80300.1 site-specific integrase [Methylocystis silviterrae]